MEDKKPMTSLWFGKRNTAGRPETLGTHRLNSTRWWASLTAAKHHGLSLSLCAVALNAAVLAVWFVLHL